MNATGPYWWSVNIGSGNGLVLSGSTQLPDQMLTQINVDPDKCWPRSVSPNSITRSQLTHIYVSNLTIVGWDNRLPSGWRQAIIWTKAGILLIWPLETNFGEIGIEILTFSLKKMHLKILSAKWRPFCLMFLQSGVPRHFLWRYIAGLNI